MRETRYLWIGNLAENVREDRIADYFRRYGKIDKVRFLSKRSGENGLSAYIAFMDIRSAQKAKTAVNIIGDRELLTDYFDPVARAGADEGQRHIPPQPSQSRNYRRYETVKDSGIDDRPVREIPAPLERSYQASDPGSNDSDKGRPRVDFGDGKSRPQASSKKRLDGKAPKKKDEDGRLKLKKGKPKITKERGRSPTIRQRKSCTSSGSSPSRSGSKRQGSSSEGRSSTSASAGRSVSEGHRSSSVSSSSSTGSSNSSKTHRSNSASSESSYEIEEKQENRKLVAMCIRNLPSRPTITSIRDGIFHEFKKYGKVKSVLVRGDGNDRHALVLFRTAGEANKAIAHARTKLLFGVAIEASIYEGEVSGQELEECGGIIDEFHPRASRTLFVGNLDKTVGYSDIQNIFVRFGEIVAIEIKKQHNIPQYAFLQYTDIMSVVRAITKMDGEKLGRNTLKLGFGKTVISSCLWVDGVTDSFTENYLTRCFMRYGPVKHVVIDRNRGQALVFYSQYDFAQSAMQKMRARKLNGSRLKLDYASNELVEIFLKHMKSSGQSFQGLENIRQLLQPPSSPVATPLPPAGAAYARTAPPQEPRAGYYEERHQPGGYNDEQYADGNNYRRGWRARSRERHGFAAEQTGYNRPKRGYDDAHPRQDYHRDPAWEHESYPDGRNRGAGQYDQDYRQRDHDLRREHRGYPRKQSTRTGAPYEENFRYRGGARDRYREERDADYVRDRDQSTGDRYYNRTAHLSPSHPRYHPRRSRSASPQPRDPERYGVERGAGDAPFRRRGSASPEARYDSLQRLNSMESKSSTHSDPRYPARGGDVDMREYLDEDKLSVPSPRSDERIVEFTERARKSRSRKRAPADLAPANDSLSPRGRYDKYRDDGVRVDRTPESFDEPRWHADSPAYSEHGRSVSGTPTRDENEDLIGEVIIKKSGSKSSSLERTKPRPKEEEKPRDKDYRKEFAAGSSAPAKSDSGGKSRSKSRSTSLIQRVHSPPPTKKDTGTTYEKDFDYRKQSKPDSRDASRHKHSKSGKPAERVRGDRDIGSDRDRAVSPAERRTPGGGPGLLKREYSPKPKEREDSLSKRARTATPSSSSKEKYKEHKRRPDSNLDRDERPSHAQKRRHSPDSDQSAVKAKRERKKSTSDHHKHKSSNDAPSQKHEAPLSIASQMFMQDEEDSGNDSAAPLPETVKPEEQAAEAVEIAHSDPDPNQDKAESPSDIGYTAASLSAALSLLPKAFTKPQKQTVGDDQPQVERKKDGALTELEKEKVRLQQLLSKLDSDKRLNPKDAEEVADVVLQELTEKARSKLNELRPQKVPGPSKATTEVVVDETVLGEDRDQEVEVDDVTFEEEVVVDTVEEVTEDEIIETEVEEVTVKEEEEELEEMPQDDKVQEEPAVVSPVVPPTPVVKPVQSADVKKEAGEEKKALEKLERKRESQIKKIFKRQEKERKKQIERVQAMRGPSQNVISSVDDDDVTEDISEEAERENVDADTVLETSEVSTAGDTPVLYEGGADDAPGLIGVNDSSVVIEDKDNVTTGSSDTVLKDSGSEELWPPDRGKEADRSDTTAHDVGTKSPDGESKATLKTVAENNVTNPDSPVTPVCAGNDTLAAVKISPRTEAQSNASVPQKPAVALAPASQTSRTPVFTTPSPASSSSSSSKSHKHRQMKIQRRHGGHPGRIGQSKDSRPHGHHGSQEHRRSSTHSHRSRSHSNAAAGHHKSDAHKRHAPQLSRRSLATITVGLDASPSKPLSKNELERLRHELESVRNQLNAGGVSPSSLSPCSDDDPCGKSQSPAQLLSPISPLLKSPGNVMAHNRRTDTGASSQSPASGPSLTDRLKLLGKVKKRSSGLASEVKVKTEAATLERVAIDGAVGGDAKLCRSSIIDQDLARLSYISDHLSGHEFNAAPMSAPPVPLNVPLFAGSKFLQPVPVPQMLPVPLNSVAPSAGVDPVPCNPPTPVSSSDGPKNVLSLSSSDLPVTAERPRDAFGKKTNTSTMDYGSEDAMEISKHEPEPTLLPDPLERDAVLPCVSQNLCDTEIIPSHSSKNSPAKSAISEDRALSPVPECVDASQTRQDALKVDAESVCAEDLEAGGCMEISVDAEDSENLGDVIIDDNVVEEITEDLKSEMETGRVVSDAETQPEKVAKAETVDGDVISKKPDEIVDVIAEIKPVPSTSGENQDAQIKKEKPKVGKKKISGKSDLPKTPKIAVKRKLSKEGKKEKMAKKDGHKKPKGDAHKTKSKVSEERAKPTDSDKESTGEKVAERTASDDELETSQAKTKSKEESGSKKTDDGVSKKRISEKKSVPADAKTDKKAKAKAEKGEVIGSAVVKEDRKLTESKSPSIRPEGSESRVDASPHLVKKKKKKHGLDKREKHSEKKTVGSTSEDKSDSKNKDGKSVREGEKNKKNPVEKSKTSENLLKTSEKSGLTKKDSKQVKSVKAHSDLKASHSAPPSAKTVPGPVDDRKKLKKTKKHEKPAKKRLVISSDSSDESADEGISSGVSKFPHESESRIVSEDEKWSDVDDSSRRSKSHWSMSSASSLEPFATGAGRSSMLTTETIKSETIMPVGYDRDSFSDSSASEDDSRSADVFRKKKRKKKSGTKIKDLKPPTESKRLFGSCSDSDMSETQLVMSLTNSESSDEISVPKKSLPKRSAMAFSDDLDSSGSETPPKKTPKPQLKALAPKAEAKAAISTAAFDHKVQSKKPEKSSKKGDGKSARKLAKMAKKEKRKHDLSSDNEPDVGFKLKSKHSTKVKKSDASREPSPSYAADKPESKSAKSSPLVHQPKDKSLAKAKKHKDQKSRSGKSDSGRLVPGHDHDKKQSRPESVEAAKKKDSAKDPDKKSSKSERFDFGESSKRRDSPKIASDHDSDKKSAKSGKVDPGEIGKKRDLTKTVSERDSDKRLSKSEMHEFGEAAKPKDSSKISSERDAEKRHKSGKFDDVGRKKDSGKISKSELGESTKKRDPGKVASERDPDKKSSSKPDKVDLEIGKRKDPVKNAPEHVSDKKSSSKTEAKEKKPEHDTEKSELIKKKDPKISSKSSAPKPEDDRKESWQKPDRETAKHKKKSSKKHKKADFSRSESESAKGKDERTKKDRLDKIGKEDRDKLKKHKKVAAPVQPESPKKPEPIKTDENQNKDITYSLFGSDSDDDDIGFTIDEEYDSSRDVHKSQLLPDHGEETVPTEADAGPSPVEKALVVQRGRSFLSSGSDDSDKEQKSAVKSALSVLGQDRDIRDTQADILLPSVRKPKSPTKLPVPPRPRSLSPLKKVSEPRDRKRSHDLCEVKRERPNLPGAGYPTGQRRHHFGVVDRRENMDKMKSISHEREEEAVRSIMGILDESSDADSYFSDVKVDETVPNQQNFADKTESDDVDAGADVVKPVPGRDESQSEDNEKGHESSQEKEDVESDLAKERSTAEENELAAAVSAIEGLFGDFADEDRPADSFLSDASPRPSSRRVSKDKTTSNEPATSYDAAPDIISREVSPQAAFEKCHEESFVAGNNSRKVSADKSDLELPSVRTDFADGRESFVKQRSLTLEDEQIRSSDSVGELPPKAIDTPWVSSLPESRSERTYQTSDVNSASVQARQVLRSETAPEPAPARLPVEADNRPAYVSQPASTNVAMPVQNLPFVTTVPTPEPSPMATSCEISTNPLATGNQPSVLPSRGTPPEPQRSQISVGSHGALARSPVVAQEPRTAAVSTSPVGSFLQRPSSRPELSKKPSDPALSFANAPSALHHPRASIPSQSAVSIKSTPTSAPHAMEHSSRIPYSHAPKTPYLGYPESMMPIHNQGHAQQPFGLPQNRFSSSQTPAMMPYAHPLAPQQPQQPDTMQRTLSSPYLLQHSAPAPHIPPAKIEVSTPTRNRDAPKLPGMNQSAENSESQRTSSSNPNLAASSVPNIPHPYLHPQQANMQQKQVFPSHLYYPNPGMPHYPNLSPYMPPFLGMRPNLPSVPIVRTPPEEPQRQTPKPQTPQQRSMTPLPYRPRLEQPAHIPSSRPLTHVNPQMAMHPSYNVHHAQQDPSQTAAIHQTQHVKHESNQYQPPRAEHGERYVRADNEQSQMDMVDQHFAMSGVSSNLPPGHQNQTVKPESKVYPNHDTQPSTTHHQPMPGHGNMYQQVIPRHALNMPPRLLMHGEKYAGTLPGVVPTMQWPYPAPGGNFRPPSVGQQPSPVQARVHPAETYQGHATGGPGHSADAPDQVMDLFQRYPVIWQGLLALKNDSAAVQTHFICGDRNLAQACLPQPDSHAETDKERNLAVLRIVQRMRLEPHQLEGIDSKIMENSDYCLLLALPCGRDKTDVNFQQTALKRCFIDYLKQKQAAGIVNVQHQQMRSDLQYVLHVFPPCDFTTKHLQCHARDLLSNINDIQHIMIVIAAV